MWKYLNKLMGKKTLAATGASLIIWALLLTFMATDPLPETLQPGVFESFNLSVPQLNKSEDDEDRRRYLMLPVG